MEFKARASNTFLMNMFLIAFALLMAASDFAQPPKPDGFWHYRYIGWLLISMARLFVYWKYLYILLTGKLVLSVNEVSVQDLVKNIKYNWNDIKEIYDENGYLYLKMYMPADYVRYIKNPIKRLRAMKSDINLSNQTPFKINMDMVNVNPNVLLQLLDDYSVLASDTKIK
ncbi:MAG: STM3941 family protein [Bacteroidota bacterium]